MSPYGTDTLYNGILFRSQLEASWAAFFDSRGIAYEYEEYWFEFDDGERYCPDFWLPEIEAWAEVKPRWLNTRELRVALKAAQESGCPCLKLVGAPENKPYWAIMPDGTETWYRF